LSNKNARKSNDKLKETGKQQEKRRIRLSDQYLFNMSHTPGIEESTHWFQMAVAAFFTAVIVMITRMASYERPMSQFYWNNSSDQLTDFFSYYKMVAILVCALLALTILVYRAMTQSFYIKRSYAYVPMAAYSLFVIMSYIFSDYKEFSLFGWNDRFEGTLPLLAYMTMLFFIINCVNSEKNVRWIVSPLAVTSAILGLLGLSQGLGHDFFRTEIGKKLITPSWFWDKLDTLNFIFKNNEIYQTVYNINYVSFYLTLLIPLFGLLFIRSVMLGKAEPVWKKILWAALFTLLIFNLIGSASSGGLMGMGIAALVAILVLNRRILDWWKPVVILLVLLIIIGGVSFERWMPELSSAIKGSINTQTTQINQAPGVAHKVDFMETKGNDIIIGYEANTIIFTINPVNTSAIAVHDSEGNSLKLLPAEAPFYKIDDERFEGLKAKLIYDEDENSYLVIDTNGKEWTFRITRDGPRYLNGLRNIVELKKVPAVGWEDNQAFGSGRGYIWSRTIPMMKETILLGHGADTFCAFFPHYDYVGKWNSVSFSNNLNVVIDKPHNMYFGIIIGTGAMSLIALLVLWGVYLFQSLVLYRRIEYSGFLPFAGAGIFIGISGFLAAAFVNDSSVSVMPMFYGLLGTGIAINMILANLNNNAAQ